MKDIKDISVSIIIPLYNAEKYARRTIDELLCQTHAKFELIIINDGSTDGTDELCREYAARDSRIKYISQENAGVGAVRNRGIHEATADFLMFMDADDEIDADFVEKLLYPVAVQGADLAVADIDNVYTETGAHRLSEIRLPYGVIEAETDLNVISKIRTFCWGKIYRKSLWTDNNIYFPEGELYRTLPGFEDICCLPLLAARAKKIAHVGGTFYHYYRGHEGGLMHGASLQFFLNSLYELINRFQKAGLFIKYHAALRKFILGQLVSANRWILTAEDKEDMWKLIAAYFPELMPLQGNNIYSEAGIIHDVLKHIIFDRDTLKDEETALELMPEDYFQELISAYEGFCFDMADKLIDALPEILADRDAKPAREQGN